MLQSSATGNHAAPRLEQCPMTILPNLAQENEALKAKLAMMAEQLAAANKPKAITLKVSEKGALSIYGLGRFPVTLYRGQIERLLSQAPQIKAFIEANSALFATKD
jgi:hypothetical protein